MKSHNKINIKEFAYDKKGHIKFASFYTYIKKIEKLFINALTITGLSLLFGIVFLIFSLLAIKSTMLIPLKIAYLILSSFLTLSGFGFFLYSFIDACKLKKRRTGLDQEIDISSDLFRNLIKEEVERHSQQLLVKSQEIQKHQIYLEELKKYLSPDELFEAEKEEKIIRYR